MLALTHTIVLPSASQTASALQTKLSRLNGWPAQSPADASRSASRPKTRTARGRCGSLLLHRSGLSPPTPCRSPGAPGSFSLRPWVIAVPSVVIAGLMLAVSFAIKLAVALGFEVAFRRDRALGIGMDAMLVALDNLVPKMVHPLAASRCSAAGSLSMKSQRPHLGTSMPLQGPSTPSPESRGISESCVRTCLDAKTSLATDRLDL